VAIPLTKGVTAKQWTLFDDGDCLFLRKGVRAASTVPGYWAGSTTVLPSMVTAVCASSLPLIDAPVRSVTEV
jgi:hypothetical protein